MHVGGNDLEAEAGLTPKRPARIALLAELEGGLSADGIRHRRRAHYRRSLSWVVAIRTAIALRRLADASLAFFLIVLFSPVLIVLVILSRLSGGGIRKQQRL